MWESNSQPQEKELHALPTELAEHPDLHFERTFMQLGKYMVGEKQSDSRVTSFEGYWNGSQLGVILFLLSLGYLKMCGGVLVVIMTRVGRSRWLKVTKCSNMWR